MAFLDAKKYGNVSHPQEDYHNWLNDGYGTRMSRRLEIDVTTDCNMKCFNCSRSCRQAPSNTILTLDQMEGFVDDSLRHIETKKWDLIKITGGEPSTHPDLYKIFMILLKYKLRQPALRVWYNTHGHGKRAEEAMKMVREFRWVENVNSSRKTGPSIRTHDSFNKAPIDFDLPGAVCPRAWDCGMGFTYHGFYPCGDGAAIDRVFGFDIGIMSMEQLTHEAVLKQMEILCPYCGNSPTDIKEYNIGSQEIQSESWVRAYNEYEKNPPMLPLVYSKEQDDDKYDRGA